MRFAHIAAAARYFGVMACGVNLACSAAGPAAGPVNGGGGRGFIAGAVAEDEWVDVDPESEVPEVPMSASIAAWPLGSAAEASTPAQQTATATAYALDGVSRRLLRKDAGSGCLSQDLLSYFGTQLRFGGVAVINPAFREHLERFEEIVNDVAIETYGRRPLLIRHRGAFACRSRRNQPLLLSEHALGNAIDVSGFEFAPAAGSEPAPIGTPTTAFRVDVAGHWQSDGENRADQRHSRFLRSVIARLVARGDVFRGIITPSDPAHANHFHFDMAPRSYVRL